MTNFSMLLLVLMVVLNTYSFFMNLMFNPYSFGMVISALFFGYTVYVVSSYLKR